MPFRGRIAYPSYVDESLFGNPHEKAVQMARSMPASIKDSVLVSGVELNGMRNRTRLGAPAPLGEATRPAAAARALQYT